MEKQLLEYRRFLVELDLAIEAVARSHFGALRCGPGCASCCKTFSLLPVEAASVHAALRRLAEDERRDCALTAGEDDSCPFLRKGLCMVYAHRPIICRSQGLPIGYVDEERQCIEVSACPLNFPDDSEFNPETLLFLDPFNDRLRAVNEQFLKALALPQASFRIPMAVIAKGELPRNLVP